VIIWISMTSP